MSSSKTKKRIKSSGRFADSLRRDLHEVLMMEAKSNNEKVAGAKSFDECVKLHRSIHRSEENLLQRVAIKALGYAKSFDECMQAYSLFGTGERDEPYKIKALEKALGYAESFEEYMKIYELGIRYPDFVMKTVEKVLKKANSFDDCVKIYKLPQHKIYVETDMKILEKALGYAGSFDECMWVYMLSPLGTNLEKSALEKACEEATSLDEYLKIYGLAPYGSDLEKKALKLINSFEKIGVIATSYFDKCLKIYNTEDGKVPAEIATGITAKELLEKALGHAESVDECLKIYISITKDDVETKDLETRAYKKAAKIAGNSSEKRERIIREMPPWGGVKI